MSNVTRGDGSACFSLRSGEVLRAPVLTPIACWRVEPRDGIEYVREKLERPGRAARTAPSTKSIVVTGGGAGNAAAEMLRAQGYSGDITMLSTGGSSIGSLGHFALEASYESSQAFPLVDRDDANYFLIVATQGTKCRLL